MRKLADWILVAVLVAGGIFDLAQSDSALPPAVTGALLIGLGLLVGLRLGSESRTAFVNDLLRMNNALGEQNKELGDLNRSYVKHELADSTAASEETSGSK